MAKRNEKYFYTKPVRRVASQFFSGKPEGPFCQSCTFGIFPNERNWMKKSARVSEKLVSPGLPGLQVATRLPVSPSSVGRFVMISLRPTRVSSVWLSLVCFTVVDCFGV